MCRVLKITNYNNNILKTIKAGVLQSGKLNRIEYGGKRENVKRQ